MGVTLKDVALAANLHVSTVSRALHNDARHSLETRQKVQEIARKLGYHPNPLLTTLMANRRHKDNAGVVSIASISYIGVARKPGMHPWSDLFHAGFKSRSESLGFSPEVFYLDEFGFDEKKLLKVLYARGFSGLVWWSSAEHHPAPNEAWNHFAGVTLGHQFRDYSSVNPDAFQNIQMAVKGALNLGYKKPGFFLTGNVADSAVDHYHAGFLHAVRGLPTKEQVPFLNHTAVSTYNAWFKRYRPDVIISNSSSAFSGVPLVALDWIPQFHGKEPSFPGIEVGWENLGRIAVDLVAGHLYHNERGLGAHARHNYHPGEWIDSPKKSD